MQRFKYLTLGPASLILNNKLQIYHAEAENGRLAHGMVDMGDPNRVKAFAEQFFKPGFDIWEHRGHIFTTGYTPNGARMSAVATCMGVGSTDIIGNEQIATHALDFANRRPREDRPTLGILRLGTCGALRDETKLGVPIISEGAVGVELNGILMRQRRNRFSGLADKVSAELTRQYNLQKPKNAPKIQIPAYGVPTSPTMLKTMLRLAKSRGLEVDTGVTVTASGFYFAQGRCILPGVKPAIRNIDRVIAGVDPRIRNFEMEISLLAILAYLSSPRHHAGCICVPVAHRPTDRFMEDIETGLPKQVEAAGLLCIATIEAMYESGDITPH